MLKILQARLQQYVNRELPDVQAGFRKGRGTRDQIANIRWVIKKARDFQINNLISGGFLILVSLSGSFNLASGVSWLLLPWLCVYAQAQTLWPHRL